MAKDVAILDNLILERENERVARGLGKQKTELVDDEMHHSALATSCDPAIECNDTIDA